jgi:hypothetical protein
MTMYLGSMDHSPSEQLGDPNRWHTTVLILSEGNEHWNLAKDIALELRCPKGQLQKWSRIPNYRRNGAFEDVLGQLGPKYPVQILAISAQARAIEFSVAHMIEQLGMAGLVVPFVKNGKSYLRFGPFEVVRIRSDERGSLEHAGPVEFTLVRHQAVPMIFISHYLLRMHQQLLNNLQVVRENLHWLDIQIMPNKFPGGTEGPMAALFHAIMSGASHQGLIKGNVRVMTFVHSHEDAGSALADNIAGLLTEKLNRPKASSSQVSPKAFHWEVWRVA